MHTNIGRARRQKSIPTILTETVAAQGVQPQENVTTFLNLFWVPITSSWPPKEKKYVYPTVCDEVSSRRPLVILLFKVDAKMKCLEHSAFEIHVSILCSGALRNKTKEVNLPYTYKGFPLFHSPSLGAKNKFLMYQNCLFEYLTASGCAKVG